MTDPEQLGPAIDRAGKYRLGVLLGVGGMAEVYRGYIVGIEGVARPVAIKRVLATYSADERFSAMFVSEARLASLLSHPCVVGVLDFERDLEGRLFQVLEFVDGIDLEHLAPPGETAHLPPEVIIYIIGEVLEGLHHAHVRVGPTGKPLGIVHRDCTPSNVLLTWDGTVRLSDFGIAKAMQATQVTNTGTVKGKPTYMAPEQAIGSATIDARVDLFAVGVMLYELLTGLRPFQGDTVLAILSQIHLYGQGYHRVPSPNEATGGQAPTALSNLAMRLMAPKPDQRPATAQDALAELRLCGRAATRDELAVELAQRFPQRAPRPASSMVSRIPAHNLPTNVERARAPGPGATVQTIGHTPPPVGDLPAAPVAPRSRRPLFVALAAGVVVVGAVLTISLSGNDHGSQPDAATSAASVGPGVGSADAALPLDAGVPDADVVEVSTPDVKVDAAPTDAPAAQDAAQGRPRRDHSTGAGSGTGHRFVEKTIGGT